MITNVIGAKKNTNPVKTMIKVILVMEKIERIYHKTVTVKMDIMITWDKIFKIV